MKTWLSLWSISLVTVEFALISNILFVQNYNTQLDSLSAQNITQQDPDNRTLLLEAQNDTKFEPANLFGPANLRGEGKGELTSDLVAEELSNLSPDEIVDYPLHELSSDDIERTLTLLSDEDLNNVLYNIHPDSLQIILIKISPSMKSSVLERLVPATKARVSTITDIS